ncbi:39S ribosomal protein L46, mitochondrial [Folsomia candida]|uniref:Large ribosomal subunit protein mL46 n=1 Tax=Folsomia candida TaxID=158441 RepID=A0A226EGL8_FOLCA|nr:39S ribosomal protein L46, mitochondrial [Folsomia candida]OXA56287.1 hypothetical protein Fcan01_09327 [Folsomia candida]
MSLTVRTFSCYLLRKSSRQLSSRFLSTSSISSQSQFSSPSKSQLSNQQSSLPPLAPEKWDLYAGVVLERKPVLTPEMTPLEKEYSTLLSKYEFELSKKSSHEVRKEKDSKTIEKIKSGEIDVDQAASITAQDEEDLWLAELNQFKFSSRKTDADKNNDQKSLQRALDSHLLLLIEQKLGNDYKWICPQGIWRDGETMRQTADRVLKEVCPEIKAKVLGNAPWGFYKYKYPKRSVTSQHLSSVGAKIFFFKAQVISGEIQNKTKSKDKTTEYKDLAWLTREELISKLQPEYHKQISEFLIDEEN